MAVCISHVTDIEKLKYELLGLQNRTGTHTITEILRLVLRGFEGVCFRVLVDSWPEWTFVGVEHNIADDTQISGYFSTLSVWAKTGDALCNTLKNNSDMVIADRALPVEIEQAGFLREGVSHWGKTVNFLNPLAVFEIKQVPHEMYAKYTSLPRGFALDTLRADDMNYIHGHWLLAGNYPKSFLLEAIKHLPSACVRDPSGRCVSWGLVLFKAAIGHLFTLPEHRGKGFARAVVIMISKACNERGIRAFALVQEVNKPSMKVFESIVGVTRLPGTMITGIISS